MKPLVADAPVEAHASPLPDQLWALMRQVVPPLAAYAAGRGWLSDDTMLLLGATGAAVWAFVAGQLKTRRRALELASVAANPATPDHVAKLR